MVQAIFKTIRFWGIRNSLYQDIHFITDFYSSGWLKGVIWIVISVPGSVVGHMQVVMKTRSQGSE